MKKFFCRAQVEYVELTPEEGKLAVIKAEIKQLKKDYKLLSISTYPIEHSYTPYIPTNMIHNFYPFENTTRQKRDINDKITLKKQEYDDLKASFAPPK